MSGRVWIGVVYAGWCALSFAAPATTSTSLLPVPDSDSQLKATTIIRSVLRKEYATHSLDDRRALAKKLLNRGYDTTDDLTARYVLLRDAEEIASSSGDAITATRAIDAIAERFNVDTIALKTEALAGATKNAVATMAQEEVLARCCLETATEATVKDRYEPAERLLGVAESSASKSGNADLVKVAQERNKELSAIEGQYERSKAALKAVSGENADIKAYSVAGKFICFIKGDWETGLPLLAHCEEEPLQTLAQLELANPTDAIQCAQVGDGWWNLAEKQQGLAKSRLLARAQRWYRKATPGIAGITKDRIRQRLGELDLAKLRELHMAPGLLAELFEGQDLQRKKLDRVDPLVDFAWGKGNAPADGMPKKDYSVRWSGQLKAPSDGVYTLIVIANTGARLIVNDKVIIENPMLSRKRNGERITVNLGEGLHPIKLEFWTGSGESKAKLLWICPGESKEQVIPADALYHDASGGV